MKQLFLSFIILLSSTVFVTAQSSWVELGTGANALNANLPINALTADISGNIYAAGNFTDDDGYHYVAKWNGATWAELGTGSNALAANGLIPGVITDADNNVYAAGGFRDDLGNLYVAKWDGTSWSELGADTGSGALNLNFFGLLYRLAADATGNIYVSGAIDSSGSEFEYSVAKWNGASWVPLLGDLNAMHVYDSAHNLMTMSNFYTPIITDPAGNVYAANYLYDTTGNSNSFYNYNEVAKWDGTSWAELGTYANGLNMYGNIWAITIDPSNNIYVAGEERGTYDSVNEGYDMPRLYVAKWDGTSWAPLDTAGLNGIAYNTALGVDLGDGIEGITSDATGNIYVGGEFIDANGNPFVAKWDGTSWSELGTGAHALNANDHINKVIAVADNIYAAGRFVDSSFKRYVAMYATGIDSVVVKTQNNVAPTINVNAGTLQLVANVSPSTASQDVSWSIVPGTGTATISNTGLVTAGTAGTLWGKAASVADPTKMDSLQITISHPTGINEVANATGLRLYPNPATDQLTIEVGQLRGGAATVSVYNVKGDLVKTVIMKNKNINMDVSDLSPGVYMLQYMNSGDNQMAKFTKY